MLSESMRRRAGKSGPPLHSPTSSTPASDAAPPDNATCIRLRNDRAAIERLRDEIIDRAEVQGGFDERERFGLRLAFEEAVSNAFVHGNRNRADSEVEVVSLVEPGFFYLRVVDEGEGFDPEAVPDPTLDENLERLSGRGLLLMRAYMSEIIFSGRGNCVTLIRRK